MLKISKSSILRSVFSVRSLKKEGVQFFGKRLRFSKFKWLCSCSCNQKEKNLNTIQFRLEQVLKISKSSILRSVFSVRSLKKEEVQFFWKNVKIFQVQMAVFMFRHSEILKPERNPVKIGRSAENL